jgi:hypothetical protein
MISLICFPADDKDQKKGKDNQESEAVEEDSDSSTDGIFPFMTPNGIFFPG